MTWSRTLLLAFRGAVADVLAGRSDSIPDRLLRDVVRAVEQGVVTDPNGQEVLVDRRTRVRFSELLTEVASAGASG